MEPGFFEHGTFSPSQDTYPNGCHIVEVEIDPDTGAVEIVSYKLIDDVGTVINPLTLYGQIHGGIAQGVGQALMENVIYDSESGQLLTASFMDYAMPRADTFSDIEIHSNPIPTSLNPIGAKGAGEAGTVGALPAVTNAIVDALASAGVRAHFDMPATADRVWHALQNGARS
jgi:aerobic carbon-monoxide dehydrogenase large subunit